MPPRPVDTGPVGPDDVPPGGREGTGEAKELAFTEGLGSGRHEMVGLREYFADPDNLELYRVLPNEQSFGQAAEELALPGGEDLARTQVNDLKRARNPNIVAKNLLLIKRADEAAVAARAAGDEVALAAAEKDAADLVIPLARYVNKAGQEIQLLAGIRKFSSDGIRMQIVKGVDAYVQAAGGEVTPALRKQLDKQADAEAAWAAKRAGQKVEQSEAAFVKERLAERETLRRELEELRGVPAGFRTPESAVSALKDILFPNRLKARMRHGPTETVGQLVSDETMDALRVRAESIMAMPPGAKRDTAHAKMVADLEAMPKTPAPAKPKPPVVKGERKRAVDGPDDPDDVPGPAPRPAPSRER